MLEDLDAIDATGEKKYTINNLSGKLSSDVRAFDCLVVQYPLQPSNNIEVQDAILGDQCC